LRASGVGVADAARLHHARLEPFPDQAFQHAVSYPELKKLAQMGIFRGSTPSAGALFSARPPKKGSFLARRMKIAIAF
jgi:hypothetical protein